MKRFFIVVLFLSIIFQYSLIGQFQVLGEAVRIERQCYQLTADSVSGYGKIISNSAVNLNNPLTLHTEMFFGENDQGGNGIVFFFQRDKEVSTDQDSLYGIGSNSPSIGIEFDTKQDPFLSDDPDFDHVALVQNGDFNHQSGNTLQGPIRANNTSNIEDGDWHAVRIDWNPATQVLSMALDCEEKISYQMDLINEAFDGESNVFYGFSGGAFNSFNRQEVCVELNSLTNRLQNVTICSNTKTQINAITGGASYQWTPSEGLNIDNRANPIASPSESTTYFLEVETGYCDEVLNYSIDVNVDSTEAQLDIGKDTILCIPETYLLDATSENATGYRWSNGVLDSAITVNRTARYDVTVTFNDACIAEDWTIIRFTDTPQVYLGNDTTICQKGDGYVLVPEVNIDADYLWENGSTADSIIITRAGFYMLTVENQCGSNSDGIFIVSENCQDFYMPNAFTPNADGFNDEMYPYTENGDILQITKFSIYNRWGNQVHLVENGEPNNRSLGWDGTVNGKKSAQGVYMYDLILRFRDEQEILIKGNFTLF